MAQRTLMARPLAALSLCLVLPLAAQAALANTPSRQYSTVVDVTTGTVELSLVDGVWTDRKHTPGQPLLAIRRGSSAFSSLLDLLPSLQPVFQLGEHVIVNVGACSVAVSPRGMEYASPDDLASLLLAGEQSIGTL